MMATPSECRSTKSQIPGRSAGRYEEIGRLEAVDQSAVGRDQLAAFSLRQGDMEAVKTPTLAWLAIVKARSIIATDAKGWASPP